MQRLLVMTVIGQDRPGLVESVAALVAEHGGNWLESRMSRLGGQFAGILRVEVPGENEPPLVAGLKKLESQGLTVVVHPDQPKPSAAPARAERAGDCRPGPARHSAGDFPCAGQLRRERRGASNRVRQRGHVGRNTLQGRARLSLPESCDTAEVRQQLERIAADLIVEISLADLPEPQRP